MPIRQLTQSLRPKASKYLRPIGFRHEIGEQSRINTIELLALFNGIDQVLVLKPDKNIGGVEEVGKSLFGLLRLQIYCFYGA